MKRHRRFAWLPAVALCAAGAVAHADDTFTAQLEMAQGKLIPEIITAPAGKRIRIEVKNTGTRAVEFESNHLRKEKVLAPGAQSVVVIAPQEPGEYEFFDDFNPKVKGKIVVK